jgi:ornithine cyclodeaminase
VIVIPEQQSAALITHEIAFDAVREALIAAADERSDSFPTVLGHGSRAADSFAIKSAATAEVAGLKVGSYWPGNGDRGLARHNSLILLFDQEVGKIGAAIEAGQVNAYRTAAADAVAADVLARADAKTLAVFGSGHQALYECAALSRVRPIETVLVVARDPDRGAAFVQRLEARGLNGTLASPEQACEAADIVVTATTSRAPLFDARWIRPGTHVATMGSDAVGKQELPEELLRTARLFCDWPTQSTAIGEFQHVAERVSSGIVDLIAIGDVLAGRAPGRQTADEVTVFDSSGIALQDLYVGTALLRAWEARG